MSNETTPPQPPEKRSWLWQKTRSKWLLGLPIGAFLAAAVGAMLWIAFDTTIHLTNSEKFCASCHIGMDTVVEEYQASIHYNNRSGVRARCADCHVPVSVLPMFKVKTLAMADVYHKLMGTITLENFEQHRPRLAQKVWRDIAARGSAECKVCHALERMDPALQSRNAVRKHDPSRVQDKTCIDCHTGVAHSPPKAEFND